MAKNGYDYFRIKYLFNLILAIIPVTAWICGVIVRFQEKKYIAGLLRIIFGWNIIWIFDLICMIVNKRIFRLLNV